MNIQHKAVQSTVLQYTVHGAIATITLKPPPTSSTRWTLPCASNCTTRCLWLNCNPAIRAVVITGTGRAFCSGGDLRFALDANPTMPGDSFLALTEILHACIQQIRELIKPVIAMLNGPAAGAGLFLALACDLRIMADDAYLKQSNTSHGLSIPAGGTHTLPHLVGMARALEIAMLDEPIPAARARASWASSTALHPPNTC